MASKIQLRRDSSADWTTINPVLSEGEVGFETNTGKFKIGNGSSTWSALDYFLDSSDLSGYLTASSASTTYLTQSSASTTYLTQASASTTYQTKVANVSDTEIGYLDGVSSGIQNQIDSKLSITSASTTYATKNLNTSTKTGTYTLASGDEGSLIQLSGSNNYTVSIPTDATFNFAVGTQITLLNTGTGIKTIAAATPATTTVNATPGKRLRSQWSNATLIKLSSNDWVIIGDLIE